MIKRMRIEPISTYLERYRKGGVVYPVTIANGFVYLSGLPPFDPESGEIILQPFERQCELVLQQLKHCLEAAGSSLSQVIKCNVYCVPGAAHFSTFNAVYDRFFPRDAPSRARTSGGNDGRRAISDLQYWMASSGPRPARADSCHPSGRLPIERTRPRTRCTYDE